MKKQEFIQVLINNGAKVLYVYDKDYNMFISNICRNNEAAIFTAANGFYTVNTPNDTFNPTFNIIQLTNGPVSTAVIEPSIAIKMFLDNRQELENRSVLLLMIPNVQLSTDIKTIELLREYYNDLKIWNNQTNVVNNVSEYTPSVGSSSSIERKTVIIMGDTPNPPAHLVNYCINIGTISRKLVDQSRTIPKEDTIGLTSKEITLAMNIGSSDTIKQLRKSIFTSNSVIKELNTDKTLDDIGGYETLRKFVLERKQAFNKYDDLVAKNIYLKGLFIAGVPGSGKTITQKAIAREWELPAYELNLERALGRYVGDSESALTVALDALVKMAPAFVFVDEIDKVLAGLGEGEVAGSDVPKRLFGILLKYMSDNNGLIFGVTANRVNIPGEFMRKGRFDKIFFMDLPDEQGREHILKIHFAKRKVNTSKLTDHDIKQMVVSTKGMTGAEIETTINETLIKAMLAGSKSKVNLTKLFTNECVSATRVNLEKNDVIELRAWAAEYATNAN